MANAAILPSFLWDMESRMRAIAVREYDKLAASNQWRTCAKQMPLTSKRERITWLLSTAMIEYVNRRGGEVTFEDMVSAATEIDYKAATAGLKLNRFQMSDVANGVPGGEALQIASK